MGGEGDDTTVTCVLANEEEDGMIFLYMYILMMRRLLHFYKYFRVPYLRWKNRTLTQLLSVNAIVYFLEKNCITQNKYIYSLFLEQESQDNQESYVVIEGDQGEPVVFLQSALQQTNHNKIEIKKVLFLYII